MEYQQRTGLRFQDVFASLVSGSVPAPTAGELDETLSSRAHFSDGSLSLSNVSSWACHWPPLRSESSPTHFTKALDYSVDGTGGRNTQSTTQVGSSLTEIEYQQPCGTE